MLANYTKYRHINICTCSYDRMADISCSVGLCRYTGTNKFLMDRGSFERPPPIAAGFMAAKKWTPLIDNFSPVIGMIKCGSEPWRASMEDKHCSTSGGARLISSKRTQFFSRIDRT